MRTNFYLDGKKTTRQAVKELVGEERLKEMIQEAKETFFEDSNIQNSYFLGSRGMLTIEFAEGNLENGQRKGTGGSRPFSSVHFEN